MRLPLLSSLLMLALVGCAKDVVEPDTAPPEDTTPVDTTPDWEDADADGDPTNGAQPTIVVVGDVQVLLIVKDVAVVGGGAALPGATLEYSVTVQNPGTVPAQYVLLRDDLDEVTPGYLAYVDQSATLNGVPAGVSVAA